MRPLVWHAFTRRVEGVQWSAPALRRKRVTFTLLFGTHNTASQRGASMSLACESKLTLHYIAHPASAHVSKSKIRRHLKSEVRTVPDYKMALTGEWQRGRDACRPSGHPGAEVE